MENENKDKVILTDEELKEVAGGSSPKFAGCMHYRKIEECAKKSDLCRWSNGKCVSKLGQGLTNKNAIVWKTKTKIKTSSSLMRN